MRSSWTMVSMRSMAAVPPGACRILRRTFDLFLGQVGSVALKACVIVEHAPRYGVIVLAHSQEAAEAHDRIGNFAADLVDHHPIFDPSVAYTAVPLNLIAA